MFTTAMGLSNKVCTVMSNNGRTEKWAISSALGERRRPGWKNGSGSSRAGGGGIRLVRVGRVLWGAGKTMWCSVMGRPGWGWQLGGGRGRRVSTPGALQSGRGTWQRALTTNIAHAADAAGTLGSASTPEQVTKTGAQRLRSRLAIASCEITI